MSQVPKTPCAYILISEFCKFNEILGYKKIWFCVADKEKERRRKISVDLIANSRLHTAENLFLEE
jgi:hypothetical protein